MVDGAQSAKNIVDDGAWGAYARKLGSRLGSFLDKCQECCEEFCQTFFNIIGIMMKVLMLIVIGFCAGRYSAPAVSHQQCFFAIDKEDGAFLDDISARLDDISAKVDVNSARVDVNSARVDALETRGKPAVWMFGLEDIFGCEATNTLKSWEIAASEMKGGMDLDILDDHRREDGALKPVVVSQVAVERCVLF